MKAWVRRYAEKIDNASLRERGLMFVAAALALIFMVNAILVDPLRARQKSLAAQAQLAQEELRALDAGLQGMLKSGGQNIDAANQARQLGLRAEVTKLNSQIAQEQRRFTPPDSMRAILEEMLRQNKRLTLVDLKTLPVTSLANVPTGSPGLFRHGIELTVSGGYSDLYEYLKILEHLPSQLYWGRAELVVGDYPAISLKLTLYTVSFNRAWLVV